MDELERMRQAAATIRSAQAARGQNMPWRQPEDAAGGMSGMPWRQPTQNVASGNGGGTPSLQDFFGQFGNTPVTEDDLVRYYRQVFAGRGAREGGAAGSGRSSLADRRASSSGFVGRDRMLGKGAWLDGGGYYEYGMPGTSMVKFKKMGY